MPINPARDYLTTHSVASEKLDRINERLLQYTNDMAEYKNELRNKLNEEKKAAAEKAVFDAAVATRWRG